MNEVQDEIIKEFAPFGDNLLDKYIYLVELGKKFVPLDARYKNDQTLIRGCQLTTWFRPTFENGIIFFHADSSSVLVRGAISLLIRVLSGQKPEDVKKIDLYFIEKSGLRDIYSLIRANSLWKIENLMRQAAASYEKKYI